MTTRQEHMEFCKTRALAYLDVGDVRQAVASMCSDLTKHEETAPVAKLAGQLGLIAVMSGCPDEARKFIEGFN